MAYFLESSAPQLGLEYRYRYFEKNAESLRAHQLDTTFRWLISLSPWLVGAPTARLATTFFGDSFVKDFTDDGQPLDFEAVDVELFTGLSVEARIFILGFMSGRVAGTVETTPIGTVGRDWIGGLAFYIDYASGKNRR